MTKQKYYIVSADALPEVFLKVAEAKRMLQVGEAQTVGEAARRMNISRSAFYKYKDTVFDAETGRESITVVATLLDKTGALQSLLSGISAGVLSSCLSIFAGSGANVLTINQTIPTNGCAGVTISAETSEMHEGLEEMIAQVSGADGVLKFEILAG